MDTIRIYPPVVVGYINYGEVDMWGFDASLTALLNLEWSIDANYSYLGMNEFLNPITNAMDPINAPDIRWDLNFNIIQESCPLLVHSTRDMLMASSGPLEYTLEI